MLGGEKVLWTGKPTVLAFCDGLAIGVLLLAVSIALLAVPLLTVFWFSVTGVVLGASIIFLTFLKAYANTYIITSNRVCREYRLWVIAIEEAPLEKVTNVVVEQDAAGRIFRFGTVKAETAGTTFKGVVFHGVRNPAEVKERIVEAARTLTQP